MNPFLPRAATALSLAALISLGACGRKPSTTSDPANADSSAPHEVIEATRKQPAKAPPAPPAEIWKQFSGDRAFADVRKQVEIGPRPSGSAEIENARTHITTELGAAGWFVEKQEFTDSTPRGPMKFVNIIARFAVGGARPVPTDTQRAIVCSHYDTKYFSMVSFVGASDGASSTGALLELARVLALDHALASKVELVFFDGEEAIKLFTEKDGLYGSRYYAAKLRESGRAKQFQFGILWDMIGDKNLTITLPTDSPSDLTKEILAAADALGVRKNFSYFHSPILDDHVPLNTVARIPTVDLIDFDYEPWHTADDTLDKLSPASLQTIGAVTLYHLKKSLGK